LEAVDQPVLELLGQHLLPLQEVALLAKAYRFPRERRLQLSSQRIISDPGAGIAGGRPAPRKRKHKPLD
jgi:hypothetical protein